MKMDQLKLRLKYVKQNDRPENIKYGHAQQIKKSVSDIQIAICGIDN